MNDYIIEVLTEDYAKEICNWRYEGDCAVYNFSDYSIVKQNGWDLAIKEKRESEFVGIIHCGELIAYGRLTSSGNKAIIGIGLKPVFCGKGCGKDIMKLLIEECKTRFPGFTIALEVRTFNTRAIKCYLNVGFEITDKYTKDTPIGKGEFYYMEYTLGE